MDFATGLSSASLAVAVIGTALGDRRARRSERIAKEAVVDAKRAADQELWWAAIEAVLRHIGVDPTNEDMREPLRNLRVRLAALADLMRDHEGFDTWLWKEHTLGAALGRELLDRLKPGQSPDEHLEAMQSYTAWGYAFSQNLRLMKNEGFTPDVLQRLTEAAERAIAAVYARNHWPPPPDRMEGVEPL